MNNERELIRKYLKGIASQDEMRSLNEWVAESEDNRLIFKEAVAKWNATSEVNEGEYDSEQAYQRFLDATRKKSAKSSEKSTVLRRISPILRYAISAAAVVLVLLYLFSPAKQFFNDSDLTDEIVIRMSDGSMHILDQNYEGPILNESGKLECIQTADLLTFNGFEDDVNINSGSETPISEITVPFGKTFKVVLSDSSRIIMNAGSSLRFPQQFTSYLDTRTVLLEGEAFFEVTKDANKPFIVETRDMHVQVLGTSFNVSAYAEDEFVKTVLVEGLVRVSNPQNIFEEQDLVPNQMAIFHRAQEVVDVVEVNSAKQILWTRNKVLFNDRTFAEISKILERRYNVSIVNNYEALDKVKFNGEVESDSIDEVFKTLSMAEDFEYRIENGLVILSEPK